VRASPIPLIVWLVACRDPTVGPPPKRLDQNPAAALAAHILRQVPADLTHPANVRLGGGKIRYVGSRISPLPARRGSRLNITHYFEVSDPIPREMKMFVHIEDSNASGIYMNLDHFPIDGMYPLNRWKAGEIVEDTYFADLPPSVPDSLTIYIGFYEGNERLAVDDVAATDGQSRIRVATVPVEK
jgi:hypothetical protein